MHGSRSLLAFLVGLMFVFACQGDQEIPSEPGRGVDLSAGGPCKDSTFTSAVAVYADPTVQNAKLQACKDILALVKQNKLGQAELGIDALLVGISSDYHGGAGGLTAVGSTSLYQAVANFTEAVCGLAPGLSDSECLTPNNLDETTGIGEDDLESWMAVGPLSSEELVKYLVPNEIFGFGLEGTDGTYVTFAARPRTELDGPCPENFPNDCQDDVNDVDVDGPFDFLYVESCAVFGEKHIRCPDEGCEFGETAETGLGLVTDDACTAAGYTMMGFWGRFAYEATRPMQWVIHATPAYAGLTTKFGAGSPIVLADGDPRRRDVHVDVTANYPSGSEGTIIQILDHGIVIASCVTIANGTYTSYCDMSPLVPEDLDLLVTAAKTGGDGAYNASQALELGPGNPERGVLTTVTFNLQPPGKKKN